MRTATWILLGLVIALVLLIGLALGAGLLGYGFPVGLMGSRGTYGYPGGMMGGWSWGWGWILVMGLMMLVPLGFLVLLVLGIVWLVRQAASPVASAPPAPQPPAIGGVCPSCHKGVQDDWKTCPYCEQKLK